MRATAVADESPYIQPIINAPCGRFVIGESYVTCQSWKAFTVAAEADYAQERMYSNSRARHVNGGARYARYQLSWRFAVADRVEYLADVEYRRDQSNRSCVTVTRSVS